MFTHLKALWKLPYQINELREDIKRLTGEEYTATGLTLAQADRQMIREVHNLITARLEPFLEYENRRIEQEVLQNIERCKKIIIEKGEHLTGGDFNA